jgi:hypothetical protein
MTPNFIEACAEGSSGATRSPARPREARAAGPQGLAKEAGDATELCTRAGAQAGRAPGRSTTPQFIELTVSGPTHLFDKSKGWNNYVLEKT